MSTDVTIFASPEQSLEILDSIKSEEITVYRGKHSDESRTKTTLSLNELRASIKEGKLPKGSHIYRSRRGETQRIFM